MTRLIGCVVGAWLFCGPLCCPALPGAEVTKRYALLVGVSKYEHSGFNTPEPLLFPEADAKALGAVLQAGGYQVELLLGKQATRTALRKKLAQLSEQGEAEGVVLVGLFGHGVEVETVDEQQTTVLKGCFCPYDTRLRVVKDAKGNELLGKDRQPLIEPDPDSLIKLAELMTALKLARAGHRVVLADCCRTVPNRARGRSFGAGFRARDLPENTSVLFGCSPNEKAFEHPDRGHGAFTKCLLDELRAMSASGDCDTAVLAAALKKKVPLLVAAVSPRDTQTPKMFFTDSVDLKLTKDDPDYLHGLALAFGLGVKVDAKGSLEFFRKAADRGHPLATAALARALSQEPPESAEFAEGKQLGKRAWSRLKELADAGQPFAQWLVAEFFYYGIEVKKDLFASTAWYRKAAEQNLAVAQASLGAMYVNGEGVSKKDLVEGAKWIRKSVEQDCAEGQFGLGVLYEMGFGVEKDLVQAAQWYRKAAEQNSALGQAALGSAYYFGAGIDKDLAESMKWTRLAADQDLPVAQLGLGNFYSTGDGVVETDYAEAFKWYKKAADRHEPTAEYYVGYAYEMGEGVERDLAEAAKWYRKAADQKQAAAQYSLGMLYLNGAGVTKDLKQARAWLQKAHDNADAAPETKEAAQKELKMPGLKD